MRLETRALERCAFLLLMAAMTSCQHTASPQEEKPEDTGAKADMQGIWVDEDTREVFFRAQGDSIFYPDSTSQPAYFRIVGDTLMMGSAGMGYAIVKLSSNVLWFTISNGDVVKLRKSEEASDTLAFSFDAPKIISVIEVVKKDTVVNYDGERYHCYIAVNPTKYKVIRNTYSDDGVEVERIYYDNIIHISVFHGARRLFSSDLRKDIYGSLVPERFLSQSVLGNVDFSHVDNNGFHFYTTVCIPDGSTCYLLDTRVDFEGKMELELLDY